MKALRILLLIAVGVSCHLDKLLNGGGGGASPVSTGAPVGLVFSRLPSSPRAGRPIGPVRVSVVDSTGQPVAGVESTTVTIAQRSEEHTSELLSQSNLVCRPLLEKKKEA